MNGAETIESQHLEFNKEVWLSPTGKTRTVQTVILDQTEDETYGVYVHETGLRKKHSQFFNKPAMWGMSGGGGYNGKFYPVRWEDRKIKGKFYEEFPKPYRDVFRHIDVLLLDRGIKGYTSESLFHELEIVSTDGYGNPIEEIAVWSLIAECIAEAGLIVRPTRLLHTFPVEPCPELGLFGEHEVLVFSSEIVAGEVKQGCRAYTYADEINGVGWFPIGALPPRFYPAHLKRLEKVLPMLGVTTKPVEAETNQWRKEEAA